MNAYEEYFLMKEEDVAAYVKNKMKDFKDSVDMKSEEIGDGNLNYVFKVTDEHGQSVIVKQAGHVTRISEDMTLTIDRIKREANVLILHDKYAPQLVPKVYLYDDIMKCFIMEDLSDHTILRKAFLSGETFPQLINDITTYIVNTTISTIDSVMDPKDKKELQKEYTNPELCEISEKLVYTEPFNDCNDRNILYPPNADWIKEQIYDDPELRLVAGKLKNDFLTKSQALIHGDLHTGSIFVSKTSTKVIDPEFTFYGPIGYDLGNMIAHLLFAYVNGKVKEDESFCMWTLKSINDVVDLFVEKFSRKWDAVVTDVMAQELGFKSWYISTVLEDTLGVAGLELIRRVVGMAQVEDIVSIEDEQKRIEAERFCLRVGREFIKQRHQFKTGNDVVKTIQSFL